MSPFFYAITHLNLWFWIFVYPNEENTRNKQLILINPGLCEYNPGPHKNKINKFQVPTLTTGCVTRFWKTLTFFPALFLNGLKNYYCLILFVAILSYFITTQVLNKYILILLFIYKIFLVTRLREHWDETSQCVLQRAAQLKSMLSDSQRYVLLTWLCLLSGY